MSGTLGFSSIISAKHAAAWNSSLLSRGEGRRRRGTVEQKAVMVAYAFEFTLDDKPGPRTRQIPDEGGRHAFWPESSAGSLKSKLEEQLASSSGDRLRLHSGLSTHSRKQYVCESV